MSRGHCSAARAAPGAWRRRRGVAAAGQQARQLRIFQDHQRPPFRIQQLLFLAQRGHDLRFDLPRFRNEALRLRHLGRGRVGGRSAARRGIHARNRRHKAAFQLLQTWSHAPLAKPRVQPREEVFGSRRHPLAPWFQALPQPGEQRWPTGIPYRWGGGEWKTFRSIRCQRNMVYTPSTIARYPPRSVDVRSGERQRLRDRSF